jgi:hypothetical protein
MPENKDLTNKKQDSISLRDDLFDQLSADQKKAVIERLVNIKVDASEIYQKGSAEASVLHDHLEAVIESGEKSVNSKSKTTIEHVLKQGNSESKILHGDSVRARTGINDAEGTNWGLIVGIAFIVLIIAGAIGGK